MVFWQSLRLRLYEGEWAARLGSSPTWFRLREEFVSSQVLHEREMLGLVRVNHLLGLEFPLSGKDDGR